MEEVFMYFFAIGAGTAVGLSFGAIPAVLVYRYFKKKGGQANAQQAYKTRNRA